MAISDADRKAATAAINAALENYRPTDVQAEAAAVAVVDLKGEFCKTWPVVKQGLQLLKGLVPVYIQFIIGMVITAGDALSKLFCK